MTSAANIMPNELRDAETAAASFHDIRENIAQLRRDMAHLSGGAHPRMEAVKATASHVAEASRKTADVAKDVHGKMCVYVSAHPTSSVLIAAGIGALLARAWPRR